ncbi:N-6 DNA methylase [Candidatus Harpocratesius sp.]
MALLLSAEKVDEFFGIKSSMFQRFRSLINLKQKEDTIFQEKFDIGYKKWKLFFRSFYSEVNLSKNLYLLHIYCVILVKDLHFIFFYDYDLNDITEKMKEEKKDNKKVNRKNITKVDKFFPEIFDLDFFSWIFQDNQLYSIIQNLFQADCFNRLKNSSISIPSDLFHVFYQNLISSEVRHNLGEFYTPPELANQMIKNRYKFGQKIMDPACGTGVFLIEIIKKIINKSDRSKKEKLSALKQIYGFDINPIACLFAKLNFLLTLHFHGIEYPINELHIYNESVLFWKNKFFPISMIQKKFDLIIGNPAWITVKSMQDLEYKEQIKNLAKILELKPSTHQIPNIEISALFFYQCRDYLVVKGKIGFIVSKAFINGSNHALTRKFTDFDEISIWTFDKNLFPISNICLFARYNPPLRRTEEELKELQIEEIQFQIEKIGQSLRIKQLNRIFLVPYRIEKHKNQLLVTKLIGLKEKKALTELLPHGINQYKNSCYRGADIFPRALLSIFPKQSSSGRMFIQPMTNESKLTWDFDLEKKLEEFPEIIKKGKIIMDSSYIFPVLKSKHLVPFAYLYWDYAFIPIQENKATGGYTRISESETLAWRYYQVLEQIFQQNFKTGASIRTLWERINYHNNLIQPRHRSPYKVVYQRSGSYVKACIIKEPKVIIDTTNYFLSFSRLDEAYYVLGFLNAPDITKAIQIEKSARDIHKLPFTFYLPKFDPDDQNHQNLIKHVQIMEKKAQQIALSAVNSFLNKNQAELKITEFYNVPVLKTIKARQIQSQIYNSLGWNPKKDSISKDFKRLNHLVRLVVSENKHT